MSVPVLCMHCNSSSDLIRILDRAQPSFIAPVFLQYVSKFTN